MTATPPKDVPQSPDVTFRSANRPRPFFQGLPSLPAALSALNPTSNSPSELSALAAKFHSVRISSPAAASSVKARLSYDGENGDDENDGGDENRYESGAAAKGKTTVVLPRTSPHRPALAELQSPAASLPSASPPRDSHGSAKNCSAGNGTRREGAPSPAPRVALPSTDSPVSDGDAGATDGALSSAAVPSAASAAAASPGLVCPQPEEAPESESDDDLSSFHDALSEATVSPVPSPCDGKSAESKGADTEPMVDEKKHAPPFDISSPEPVDDTSIPSPACEDKAVTAVVSSVNSLDACVLAPRETEGPDSTSPSAKISVVESNDEENVAENPALSPLLGHLDTLTSTSGTTTWRDNVAAMEGIATFALRAETSCQEEVGCEKEEILRVLCGRKNHLSRELQAQAQGIRPSLVSAAFTLLNALVCCGAIHSEDLGDGTFSHAMEASSGMSKYATNAAKCVVSLLATYPQAYRAHYESAQDTANLLKICSQVADDESNSDNMKSLAQQACVVLSSSIAIRTARDTTSANEEISELEPVSVQPKSGTTDTKVESDSDKEVVTAVEQSVESPKTCLMTVLEDQTACPEQAELNETSLSVIEEQKDGQARRSTECVLATGKATPDPVVGAGGLAPPRDAENQADFETATRKQLFTTEEVGSSRGVSSGQSPKAEIDPLLTLLTNSTPERQSAEESVLSEKNLSRAGPLNDTEKPAMRADASGEKIEDGIESSTPISTSNQPQVDAADQTTVTYSPGGNSVSGGAPALGIASASPEKKERDRALLAPKAPEASDEATDLMDTSDEKPAQPEAHPTTPTRRVFPKTPLSARMSSLKAADRNCIYTEEDLEAARRAALRKAMEDSQSMFEAERQRAEERLEQVESDKKELQLALNQYEATMSKMVARENSEAMAKQSTLESEKNNMKADLLDRKAGTPHSPRSSRSDLQMHD